MANLSGSQKRYRPKKDGLMIWRT